MRIGPLNAGLYAFNQRRPSGGGSFDFRNTSASVVGSHASAFLHVDSKAALPLSSSTGSARESMITRINALLRELRNSGRAGLANEIPTLDSQEVIPDTQQVAEELTDPNLFVGRTAIVGANDRQVARIDVSALGSHAEVTLQGQVTRAAEAGVLTIVGGSGATAPTNAYYVLTGNRGSARIDLVAGESLYNAAERINRIASVTGVSAAVDADNLVLSSTQLGSTSAVQLQLLEPPPATVDGVNAAQIDSFTVVSQTAGTSQVLAGTVVSFADGARLVYSGTTSGTVAGTAAFRLTGSQGSIQVSLTEGESLAGVADRINRNTAATGVVASLDGTDLVLASNSVGAAATVQIDEIVREEQVTTSGVQSNQISDFTVSSIESGSEQVLAGEVLRTASHAAITLQGTSGGAVVDTAAFRLTGSLGEVTVSIQQGESLDAVATRVNALTGSTGVVANVTGDQLVFQSSDVGSAAQVQVHLTDITHTNLISGVNSQQITNFQVDAFTNGASKTLSGTIDQTAGIAELTFTGLAIGSLVGTTATFTLGGSQGSAQISVLSTDTLATLANRVNQQTATTGVKAVVVGNEVKFQSVGVGSDATISINVTTASFQVTGGNGNGTANGTDARATVNGQAITGTANTFQFSDAVGTYTFTTASGFTGAFNTVSITSQAGEFELTGGNGDGTASGLDAIAEINGVQLTGVANRFTVSESHGDFELEFAAGFEGSFNSVTVRSTISDFEIQGGDGAGTDVGDDFVAIINGIEHRDTSNRAVVVGDDGTYEITFADGFQGDFDAITVAREDGGASVVVLGGDENGRASGTDAIATINGTERTGNGATFEFTDDGAQVTIQFRQGFAGAFDPVKLLRVVESMPIGDPIAPPLSKTTDARSPEYDSSKQIIDEIDGLLSKADKGSEPTTANFPGNDPIRTEATGWQKEALSQLGLLNRYLDDHQLSAGEYQVVSYVIDFLA